MRQEASQAAHLHHILNVRHAMAHSYSCTTSNMHTMHSRRMSLNALQLNVLYFYFSFYFSTFDTSRVNLYRSKVNFLLFIHFLDSSLSEALALLGCGHNRPFPLVILLCSLLWYFGTLTHSSLIGVPSLTSQTLLHHYFSLSLLGYFRTAHISCFAVHTSTVHPSAFPREGSQHHPNSLSSLPCHALRFILQLFTSSFTLMIRGEGSLHYPSSSL